MSKRFDAAYSQTGRPSVPPERILKSLLLMALYSIRSERQVVERIDTDLLFRWFLDIDPAEPVFDATAFPHNRQPQTLGADKGYDSGPWYLELEQRGIEPHTAMPNRSRPKPEHVRLRRRQEVAARGRMRDRLTSVGYELSPRCGRKPEECLGCIKMVAGLSRSRWVGRWKLQQQLEIAAAAFNLVRMRKLQPT